MKILFVARNIPLPSHRENDIVLQFAKQLESQGCEVVICFPAEWLPFPRKWLSGIRAAVRQLRDTFIVDGSQVFVIRYPRLPTLSFSYTLAGFFWPKNALPKADVIHAHYVLPDGWVAMKLAQRWRCKFAVTVRQGDVAKMSKLHDFSPVKVMYRKVLSRADHVFSPSKSVVNELQTQGVCARFLPHGVSDIGYAIQKDIVSNKHRIRVLVVASLLPSKRVNWVLNAVQEYAGQKSIELIVVGDGVCMQSLQTMAKNVDGPVRFTGRVARDVVFEEMEEADIMALPSARETFGLVYIEAALRHCAVVATRGTGVDGCFTENSEMLFAGSEYSHFRESLWKLIDDDEFRQSVASMGQARTRKDYLWDVVSEQYLKIMSAT